MGVGVRLRVKHGPSEGVARRTPCACEERGEEKISAASEESRKISASLHNKQAQKVKSRDAPRGSRTKSSVRSHYETHCRSAAAYPATLAAFFHILS